MNAAIAAALFLASLVATLTLGPPLIRMLRVAACVSTAYEDAPKTHAVKTGTPTMGGLLFLPALLLALVVRNDVQSLALVLLGIACGAIGFLDDVLGIRGGRNRGLRARTKFLLTALAAAIFLVVVADDPSFGFHGTILRRRLDAARGAALALVRARPAGRHRHDARRESDRRARRPGGGHDDSAAWRALHRSRPAAVRPASPRSTSRSPASCLGFLCYNRHPAKVFMGDTGSLALGALLAGSAMLAGEMLLLLLVGGVFVAEALSVILQVAYFKATRQAHLADEPAAPSFRTRAAGPRSTITARFWVASLLLSLVGRAIVR